MNLSYDNKEDGNLFEELEPIEEKNGKPGEHNSRNRDRHRAIPAKPNVKLTHPSELDEILSEGSKYYEELMICLMGGGRRNRYKLYSLYLSRKNGNSRSGTWF